MSIKKQTVNLTEGNLVYLVLKFTLPILIGQIFQNLYNSVDSLVVGQFVGTTALAAVTTSSEIAALIVGFFTGLSVGCGVLFSRYFGAREYDNFHDAIHTAISFSAILGLVLTLLGIIASPLLLRIVSCPEDVWAEALQYLRIYLMGLAFSAIYNIGSGVLRSVGNSRDPFIYLVISGITNIVLDLVFVVCFHWDVMGVAVATVIAQFLSMVLVLINMFKTTDVYKLNFKHLRIKKELLGTIMKLGFPAAIQTSITCISNLFAQGYVNRFGSAAMAGYGASKKIDLFAGMVPQSVGLASTTIISQNLGAKKEVRAFKGMYVCLTVSMVIVGILGTLIYFFAESLMGIFISSDSTAVAYGAEVLHIILPLYYFQLIYLVYGQAIRGFGHSTASMVLSLTGMVGVRQFYLYITSKLTDSITAIFYCFPVGWFAAAVLLVVYYLAAIRIPYLKKQKSVRAIS